MVGNGAFLKSPGFFFGGLEAELLLWILRTLDVEISGIDLQFEERKIHRSGDDLGFSWQGIDWE